MAVLPAAPVAATATTPTPTHNSRTRHASTPASTSGGSVPERKYKCQFCNRAFSRSEHRSRHERSHTKERPFGCEKCNSTFVRRDLLLRHDRTVHAKDGGEPLHSDSKRRTGGKGRATPTAAAVAPKAAQASLDAMEIEQIESASDNLDVEAAAMLVADMQQKALRDSAGPFESGASTPSSRANSHDATGSSNAWERLPPTLRDQPNAGSSSSSFASQASNSQRHPFNGLLPALQNMISSLSPPEAPTSAPTIHETPIPSSDFNVPYVPTEDDSNAIMDRVRTFDIDDAIPEGFRLPPLGQLNRYLSAYFNFFHHHFPFLHPNSLVPTQMPPALVLSVLSIGALYAFEQDEAYLMHIGSKILVNQFLQHKENFSSRKCPLWAMQASLLNMIFATWSGDAKGLEWTCSIKSLLANMVAGNRYELKLRQQARGGVIPSRSEWVEDEGCRRTYYAVYVFYGLLTMTFNHTPAIASDEFSDLPLPASEALWNSGSSIESVWHEQLRAAHIITFSEAHLRLVQGEPTRYSVFATRTMINVLFLEVWQYKRSPRAFQDIVMEHKLRQALATWDKSTTIHERENVVVPLGTPHNEHPLVFNSRSVYRNALCRLEVDLKATQEALRYHDPYEVAGSMTQVRSQVQRSPEMLVIIEHCYQMLETCVRQGVPWVARSGPTSWGIEHPLAGLDLMIVLSMWLYRLEHDDEVRTTPDEMEMYNRLRGLLERECHQRRMSQLSAVVAQLWGSMMDEVVVWGVTRLVGESFRLHSQALIGYVDDVDSRNSSPAVRSPAYDSSAVH